MLTSQPSLLRGAQLRQQALHVVRQRRFPLPASFRLRMNESEANRVQRLTVECRHHGSTATAAIRRIANQRMLDCRKMNANLMRASRFQRALHERCGAEALERRDVGTRRFAARHARHLRANARTTATRGRARCRALEPGLTELGLTSFS